MEVITFNFITLSRCKNYALGENEIKKMITTGTLRQQVWMADDDELDHIVDNSQRVLKLNA